MKAQFSKFYPAFSIGGIIIIYIFTPFFLPFFFFFFPLREAVLFSDGFLSFSSVLSSAGFAGLHFPFAMIMPVFT